MSNETPFIEPLSRRLDREIFDREQAQQQRLTEAKATYARILARRAAAEPGDAAALLAAAAICFPALDKPEGERLNHQLGVIRRDLEQAAEFDRKDRIHADTLARVAQMDREAEALEAAANAVVQETIGQSDSKAVNRRSEASGKAAAARQRAEEARRRANREGEELRAAKSGHRRLYGLNW